MGLEEELEKARDKLEKTPVNKSTEKERARIKTKIARIEKKMEKKQEGTGGGYEGYAVEKQGDATVSLVGYPSVGKSLLLNKLTNAESEVGRYHFTTLDVVPGMMEYKGAKIQLLDVPGLIGGAAENRGEGKQVISVIRNSDLVVLMTDPGRLDGFGKMEEELYESGIRLDTEPPNVKVEKKGKGGIEVRTPVDLTELDEESIRQVMNEWGYTNAKIVIREDLMLDRLVDVLATNRKYMPSLKVVNKADTIDQAKKEEIAEKHPDAVPLSAENEENLGEFREELRRKLGLIRIYMKKPGKEPDRDEPLIVKKGSNVQDICDKLAGKIEQKFKYAKVWGESAKFPEQQVGEDHQVKDEDVVEIRTS
ncbi:MAG: 50S ribosome-binding GTPase [Candidatus Nanohaloarchaeota archaeon QJJ-9]|nr:50S ribosome-binding GTPase [Candidatus Nanohaloarchaeota archaeon QJJ-9]